MDPEVARIVEDIVAACKRSDACAFGAGVNGLRSQLGITEPTQTIGPGLAFRILLPAGDAIGRAMLEAGADWAIPQLDVLVGDQSPAIRCVACRALGQIGVVYPSAIVGPARRLADDPSWEVREFIANAIDDPMSGAQGDFVYALMEQWVHDESPNVRRVPTNALMRFGRRHPERVISLMGLLLHDDSRYVRDNVVFCLSVVGAAKVQALGGARSPGNPGLLLTALRDWLGHEDTRCRCIIAKTLGRPWVKACRSDALSMLHELEKDERRPVRMAVASSMRALAKLCPGEVDVPH